MTVEDGLPRIDTDKIVPMQLAAKQHAPIIGRAIVPALLASSSTLR